MEPGEGMSWLAGIVQLPMSIGVPRASRTPSPTDRLSFARITMQEAEAVNFSLRAGPPEAGRPG